MTITGGCLCGAVRYEIASAPVTTRVCWCRRCQKIGGGSGTVNVTFPAEAIKVEGELADFESVADSGNKMHARFCPKCGTPVFTGAESRPHLLAVRAGTLDDPEVATPVITIWTEDAPSWAAIDPELPRDTGQPPPPTLK
ncbi:MAG TPA: GFA family protein [Methyloceanibacter sp.]|jgi:hypothetical protein